jgi:hypothetical protein
MRFAKVNCRRFIRLAPVAFAVLCAVPLTAHAQSGPCGLFEAVEPNDTIQTIAQRCEVPISLLADLNPSVVMDAPLAMGTTISVGAFEATPTAQDIGEAAPLGGDPTAQDAYFNKAIGIWQGDGGTCSTITGSWEFSSQEIRGNAARFEIKGIYGTADRWVIDTVSIKTGIERQLVITPRGATGLSVNGPDIAADLVSCGARQSN